MNICKDEAGSVSQYHIESKGFKVFNEIKGNDMGQCEYSMPQYESSKLRILGGYWEYVIENLKGEELWRGWWNSNDEFDETISQLTIQ